jgi:hypothetical protein
MLLPGVSRDCSAAIFRQPAILRNLICPLTKRLTSRVDAISGAPLSFFGYEKGVFTGAAGRVMVLANKRRETVPLRPRHVRRSRGNLLSSIWIAGGPGRSTDERFTLRLDQRASNDVSHRRRLFALSKDRLDLSPQQHHERRLGRERCSRLRMRGPKVPHRCGASSGRE